MTMPLLTVTTFSRIFSRRVVTRICCCSFDAWRAIKARNCQTGCSIASGDLSAEAVEAMTAGVGNSETRCGARTLKRWS